MDPEANIKEQVELAKALIADEEADVQEMTTEEFSTNVVRLAELVISLHAWRSGGGFDPYLKREGT